MRTTMTTAVALLLALFVLPALGEEETAVGKSSDRSSDSDVAPVVAMVEESSGNELKFLTEIADESSTAEEIIVDDESELASDSDPEAKGESEATRESDAEPAGEGDAESSTVPPDSTQQPTVEVAVTSVGDEVPVANPPAAPLHVEGPSTSESAEEPSETSVDEIAELIDPESPREVIEELYKSGTLKVRRQMTLDREGNYIKHGPWTMFSESGEEIASGEFVANLRDGKWSRVVEADEAALLKTEPYRSFDGPFISVAVFDKGQLTGTWTIKDLQGRLASEWSYQAGQVHGTAKWFYPDGSIREQIDYANGVLDGTWQILDEDGTELENTTHQQGRKLGVKRDTYANGVNKWEGVFLHEKFVVNTMDDWWNTRPVTYKAVGEPERHGPFTSWYPSGQKKFTGAFEQEIRTGEFTWWHENTQLSVRGSYVVGERDGLWTWWHENGQKAIQGHYKNGKLDGPWSYWNAEGKLERRVDYTDENQPLAVHPTPSSRVPKARPLPTPGTQNGVRESHVPAVGLSDEPVGTGLRTVRKQTPILRRNPFRN